MSSQAKQAQQLARQFLRLSLVEGSLSQERVLGVLEYIDKHKPANSIAVLRFYKRLVQRELSKQVAVVEHAGSIDNATLRSLGNAFTARYKRPITTQAIPKPSLLAGLRVRVGDDIFEASLASRLATLQQS